MPSPVLGENISPSELNSIVPFSLVLDVSPKHNLSFRCNTPIVADSLEDGKIVVIDTSRLGDQAELLIGSSIANHIFDRHRHFKSKGILDQKNPVSIVIEEAPRVLAEEKINQSDNIFSTIAREGRKFKVGLIAITQLTSVIPKMILTNINTKIILFY